MAGIKCEIVGGKELTAKLQAYKSVVPQANNAGLYAVGCAILLAALRRVPVDTGTLKGSGYVTIPQGSSGTCTVGFGGPAESYAAVQHERLDYHHEVGEAKFLENAIKEVEPESATLFMNAMARALERLDKSNPVKRVPSDPFETSAKAKSRLRGSRRGKLTPGKKGRP